MSKWKYRGDDDADHLAKVDKIRRAKDKLRRHKAEDSEFELGKDLWDKPIAQGWFAATETAVYRSTDDGDTWTRVL